MELNQAIHERRSIRHFSDTPVSDSDIHELLESARWAPSWANTQCARFIVVRDPDIIRAITENYSERNPARDCSFSASVLIVALAAEKVSGYKMGEARTSIDNWFMFDLGMAVQNLSLRAHSLELGSVIVGSMNHARINEILSVPEGYTAVVSIPIGHPVNNNAKKGVRKDLSGLCYLDKWGNQIGGKIGGNNDA